MARVGKRLGVTAMALYRHVADREDLDRIRPPAGRSLSERRRLAGLNIVHGRSLVLYIVRAD